MATTIIKDDKWVSVDGVIATLDTMDLPANVHAIQWDGSSGWIEYNDGTANETISSMADYKTITDAHATKVAEAQALEKEATDATNAHMQTHTYKRAEAYATLEEQLDQQYWDAVNGTTTWKDGIAAVKAAHPK
jgi:hypothetical protein